MPMYKASYVNTVYLSRFGVDARKQDTGADKGQEPGGNLNSAYLGVEMKIAATLEYQKTKLEQTKKHLRRNKNQTVRYVRAAQDCR